MNNLKIFAGAFLIFCAAWLMVRLQVGSGDNDNGSDEHNDPVSCGERMETGQEKGSNPKD
jgi:hypothetical protein